MGFIWVSYVGEVLSGLALTPRLAQARSLPRLRPLSDDPAQRKRQLEAWPLGQASSLASSLDVDFGWDGMVLPMKI